MSRRNSPSRPAHKVAAAAALAGCLLLWAPRALASAELDRRYSLEVVGFLRSVDNVDGLFSDYVAAAYQDYFAHQSRFIVQDLSKADDILANSKIPYRKLVEDPRILAQVARSTRSQSLIRTRILKEGPTYRFELEWLHPPELSVIAREDFEISDPGEGKPLTGPGLKAQIKQALDKLLARVPWLGTVTGRSERSVTVNLGAGSGLHSGDSLRVGTLEEVRVHPLLNEAVDWRLAPTGRIKIEQVEEGMAFGEVEQEEPGHEIARGQKVMQVIPAPQAQDSAPEANQKSSGGDGAQEDRPDPNHQETPRMGWASAGLSLGSFSRSLTDASSAAPFSGSGLSFGGDVEGQLWFTREWFAELQLGIDSFSYSPDNGSVSGSAASSRTQFKVAAGYTYLVNNDIFGPKGWLKLGYHSNSYSLPASDSLVTAPISFQSLFVGAGGDLPIRGGYGMTLNLDFGVFNGMSQTGLADETPNGSSDVGLTVSAYYRWTPSITFRFTMDADFNNGNFTTPSGTTPANPSLTQKIITFGPQVLYYF